MSKIDELRRARKGYMTALETAREMEPRALRLEFSSTLTDVSGVENIVYGHVLYSPEYDIVTIEDGYGRQLNFPVVMVQPLIKTLRGLVE